MVGDGGEGEYAGMVRGGGESADMHINLSQYHRPADTQGWVTIGTIPAGGGGRDCPISQRSMGEIASQLQQWQHDELGDQKNPSAEEIGATRV